MKDMTAKEIMTEEVITVNEDMPVSELTDFLTEKMISGAPVVDDDGRLTGVVSLSDIARTRSDRAAIVESKTESNFYINPWQDDLNREEFDDLKLEVSDGMVVADIMTPLIFKVDEDTELPEIADIMTSGRIHRLIVTRDDEVVGIVTTMDMLKVIRDQK